MAANDLDAIATDEIIQLRNASAEVEMTLAYFSKKLANLENLLLHVLAGDSDIGAIDIENDDVSTELMEKAFTFDLLYAILNLELRELDNSMADLQVLIIEALHKISSCEEYSTELLTGLVNKLHGSEELVKQSQERVLDMKMQLAKLQMTSFSFKQHQWKHDIVNKEWKPEIQTVEQRRVLRMLEKSLARELDFEKKLTDYKQNEEDLKLKVRLTEQVAVCMEEAAEVAWGRFLEADNTSEVFTGISKEILGKLQIAHSNLRNSTDKQEEISSKLRDCVNQLNAKQTSIDKLTTTVKHLMIDNAEVTNLREKVRKLEGKLDLSESELKVAKASNEISQTHLKETEAEIETLRENLYAAEGRAGNAEEKVTHLTDTNLELTEELDFLKGSNDSNSKKVSLLEKQLRDLDNQLQHTRASSEAGQEQQNMLYSAIWDMETLIDELKQKVARAESKTESVEEQCIMLSETNSELNKELDYKRAKVEFLEMSLNQVDIEKKASAKDISVRAGLIMDTVMQLAKERERVQKQLITLTKENKLLREKLVKEQKHAYIVPQENTSCDDRELLSSELDSTDSGPAKTSVAKANEISSENTQVEKSPDENEKGSSSSENHSKNLVPKLEAQSFVKTRNYRRTYKFIAILVLLLSVLAAYLFQEKLAILKPVGS